MTEDRSPKASEGTVAASASATKQRRKRKWDQPAECLVSIVSTAVAVPGVPSAVSGISGISLPVPVPLPGSVLANLVPPSYVASSQLLQSSIPPSAAAIVQKLSQPKLQDELIIAREIVINDAEPTIRYKLTKRQTQEEIQKCTGAVVITRGKYRPPNGLPDNEKPLYLHVSAGSHLKDTAERIKAVDSAASMVEEILKQGQTSLSASIPFNSVQTNGQVVHPFTTCLFLGFNVDPSMNIAACIRGPNDQYINHIVNETGAIVELRGHGSGNIDSCHFEGSQQPLHLYLSSPNAKSLEAAKVLAENLLDTIAAECGVSRVPPSKVYSAVPPPQQLLAGGQSSTIVPEARGNPVAGLQSASCSLAPSASFASTGLLTPLASSTCPSGSSLELSGSVSFRNPSSTVSYTPPSVTGGTCYIGYGGIYPQATPLQQVALALRQAPASTPAVPSATSLMSATLKISSSTGVEADKRPQKRKFQESPVSAKGPIALNQNSRKESEFLKPGSEDLGMKINSTMPPPRKLVETGFIGMTLPRPRNMPPPPPKFTPPQLDPVMESRKPDLNNSTMVPPVVITRTTTPPKFLSSQSHKEKSATGKSNKEPVPDTLLKLMEYGEEDDDPVDSEEFIKGNSVRSSAAKPFWAV